MPRRRLVIDVICRSIEYLENDLSSAFKNPQRFYIPVVYVNMLLRSCFWLWGILKLIKSMDFSCKVAGGERRVGYSVRNARGGGGTQLWVPCHVPPKRPYFFSLAFTERPPFLPTFTQWPPYFSKISTFLTKCWEIFGHFGPESPYFLCISLKDPLFLCTLSLKDPLFWCNLSPKDPYIWGAWWHLYVTFICECPPPRGAMQWCYLLVVVLELLFE